MLSRITQLEPPSFAASLTANPMDTLELGNCDRLLAVRPTTKRGPAGTLRGGYTSSTFAVASQNAVPSGDAIDSEHDPIRLTAAAALRSDEFVRDHVAAGTTPKSGLRRKSDDGAGIRETGASDSREADTDTDLGRLRREGGKRRQLAPAADSNATAGSGGATMDRSSPTPSTSTASSSRSTPDPAYRRSSPIRVRSPVTGGTATSLRARTPSAGGTKAGPGSTPMGKLAVKPKMSRQALTPLDVDLHGQQQQQQPYRRASATSTLDGTAVSRCRSVPRRTTAPAALLRAPASAAMSPSPSASSARSSGGSSGGSSGTPPFGDASHSHSSLQPHEGSYTPPLLSSAAMAITSSSSSASSSGATSTLTATASPAVGPRPNPRGSTLCLLGQDLVLPPCVTPTEVVAYGGEAGGKALEAQVSQQQQEMHHHHLMAMDDAFVRDDGVYCPVPTLPASATGSVPSSHATSAASSRRTSLSGEPKKRRSLSVATTASSSSVSMSMSSISATSGGGNALGAQLTMTSANHHGGSSLLTAEQLCAAESLPSPLGSPGSRTSLGSLPGAASATNTNKHVQSQSRPHRGAAFDAASVDLETLQADDTAEDQDGAARGGDEEADEDGDGSTIKRGPPTRPPLPSYTSFEDVGIPRPPSPPPSPPATGAGSGDADGTAVTSKSWWQL